MSDLEDTAMATFLVMLGLFVVGLLILFAFFIASTVRDWSDERDCAKQGGKVEHYDGSHRGLWRCTVPTPERAP